MAIGLVTGALVALSQLVATSVHATAAARYRTLATLIAQQKIEYLRGEATLADGTAVQHFDDSGRVACDTLQACPTAVLTVRWSIETFVRAPSTVLIDVEATHAHRNYGAVRLFAVRARSVR